MEQVTWKIPVIWKIQEIAREKGVSREGLVHATGLSVKLVDLLWTNDTCDPLFSELEKIALILEVSMKELFEETKKA